MRAAAGFCAALGIACAAPAGAQEPATQLPPLEVTATGAALPTALDRLPVSVSRLGRDDLATAQYQVNLSEALGSVPGVVANNRQNYAQDLQISIRGFGARASFGVRGVRLYTDGIPATMPDGQGQVSHFDLLSAERLTVLRGPFSALYGASSGGVIELTTREPDPAFAEAAAWAGPDELQRYGLSGAVAGESWTALGSGSWLDTGGYRAHSAATRASGQVRLAAGDAVLLANALDLDAQDPLGLTRAQLEQDPGQAGTNAFTYDTRKSVTQSQAGLAWTPAGSAGALRVVGWAGQRRTRQFQSIPDTVQGTVVSNPTHPGGVIDLDRSYYGADLRWLRRFGELNAALGADVEFLDERRQGFQNFTGTPGPASTKGVAGPQRRDEDNVAQSWDPYAQADWAFADGWLALAGVRHAAVRFTSADRFVIAGNGDDSGVAEFDAWLPVAGVRWSQQGAAAHLAVSRGAETPTLNELAYRPDGSAGLNGELQASRSSNVELGGSWTHGSSRLELAIFHVGTRDEIVVAGSSGGRTTFRNAGRTRRDGVEAAARQQLLPGLAALVAYTYIDARYVDFAGGNRLPAVPEHSLFGELAWQRGRVSAALEALHRTAVSVNDAGTDAAPSYAACNVRVAAPLGAGFELLARLDNLLDERYAGSVIVNEANGRYFEPAPGLTAGVGLRWSAGRHPPT